MDPPRHDELWALVSCAFNPRRIGDAEPRVRELTRTLLEQLADTGGTVNLMSEFAGPIPTVIIAEIMSVPAAERVQFRRWSDEAHAAGAEDPGLKERALSSMLEL